MWLSNILSQANVLNIFTLKVTHWATNSWIILGSELNFKQYLYTSSKSM